MEELHTYRSDLITALEDVVNELSKLAAILPAGMWHQPIRPGSHTPHYILFHLRDLETQWFALELTRILSEETPTLPIFDDEAWMDSHYHPEEPASAILAELIKLRHRELYWLRNLPSESWSRLARHPWWGEHTLQWWVELQLEYSSQHLKEISTVLEL